MKRNKYTETLALAALIQLERWSRHGIDSYLEQHGGILLPGQMQVDGAINVIKGFIDGKEDIREAAKKAAVPVAGWSDWKRHGSSTMRRKCGVKGCKLCDKEGGDE